jgi:hypothetical protein
MIWKTIALIAVGVMIAFIALIIYIVVKVKNLY